MLRRYGKIILLVLLALIHAACPLYRTTQNDNGRLNSSDQHRGGDG